MAVINAFAQDAVDRAQPLTVAAAYAPCRDAALAESAIGAIGLEIESHLVDLDHVADPVPWERVEAIAAAVGRVAPSTAVTVESGGQIELSGPPDAGVGQFCAPLRPRAGSGWHHGHVRSPGGGLLTGMPPWAWRHTAPDRLPAHSDPAPDRGRPAR
jgi:hypothetical protein